MSKLSSSHQDGARFRLLLDASETAAALGVSRAMLYKMIRRHNAPQPVRIGSAIWFHVDDVRAFADLLRARREEV
jgi:predicted DNA-binding transcriptional regulator AlpA